PAAQPRTSLTRLPERLRRYSCDPDPVLYLCESVHGVTRELHDGPDQLWIQSYVIWKDVLRIVDFSSHASSFVNYALWFCEIPSHLCFSQFFASRVAAARKWTQLITLDDPARDIVPRSRIRHIWSREC